MPHRRIGQETLFEASAKGSSLDEIAKLIDWAPLRAIGNIPPAEAEACFYPQSAELAMVA